MKILGCGRYLTSAWHVILATIAFTFTESMRAKYRTRQFYENFDDKLEYVALQRGAVRFTFFLLYREII